MLKINIFDNNFIPYRLPSSTGDKRPKSFSYVKNKTDFNGITIFTDKYFYMSEKVKSKYKIAWQVESPVFSNKFLYSMIKKHEEKFDKIITYDELLIRKKPDKFLRGNFGGTTVHRALDFKEKRKKICIIHSGKTLTKNHHLRYQIIQNMSTQYNIDVYGGVTGHRFKRVEDIYSKYMYPIIIENVNHPLYFSEKLTDALACGCMPIYNGVHFSTISRYFDVSGIITWEKIETLKNILNSINQNDFLSQTKARIANSENVLENFWTNEDWIFENYLKSLCV